MGRLGKCQRQAPPLGPEAGHGGREDLRRGVGWVWHLGPQAGWSPVGPLCEVELHTARGACEGSCEESGEDHSLGFICQRLPSETSWRTVSFPVQLPADLKFQVQLESWPFSQSGHRGGSRHPPVGSWDTPFCVLKASPLPPLKFEGFPEFSSGSLFSVGHRPPSTHHCLPSEDLPPGVHSL